MSVSTVTTAKATFSIAEVNQSSFTVYNKCMVAAGWLLEDKHASHISLALGVYEVIQYIG